MILKLNDSPGQDFIRMGGGHDRVSLSGNTVQEDNDGDIVYLGDGNDHLDAKNAEGRNSVFAGTGNDRVVDGKGDLGADLGDGNDTFVHGGERTTSHLEKGETRFGSEPTPEPLMTPSSFTISTLAMISSQA